jgi:hypothetical protein
MPKVKISEYSATANSNTDVASINIDEGCAPSGINNAIRAVMGHLKDFQQGTYGDPFNGPVNGTVGATTPASGAFTTLTTTGTINLITVGRGAGAVATNTAVGASALAANSTGATSVAVGNLAAQTNSTGSNITAVGYKALNLSTTDNNTAVGMQAGRDTTSGTNNVFMGKNTAVQNTTGSSLVGIGVDALFSNTTASNNTAVGYQAGYSNSTSPDNTLIGYQAGYAITTGGYNTFVGVSAGTAVTTGVENQFFGRFSGSAMTTGSKNTILGKYSGNQGGVDIRTASNYIVLSDGDGNPRGGWDNNGYFYATGAVGAWATPSSTQTGFQVQAQFGLGCSVPSGNVNAAWYKPSGASGVDYHRFIVGGSQYGAISWNGATGTLYTTTSDYRLKENVQPMQNALEVVSRLKPVTYSWKEGNTTGQGFIAHELQEVMPDAVSGKKDGVETYKDEDGNDQTRPQYQGIDTSFLVATLTAAIKELKAEVDSLKAQINGASA